MAQLTLTIPPAAATRVLAAYGSKENVLKAIRLELQSKVQDYERKQAEAAVVLPAAPDFSNLTGDVA